MLASINIGNFNNTITPLSSIHSLNNDIIYVLGCRRKSIDKNYNRDPAFSPPLSHNFFKILRNLPKSMFRGYDNILSSLYNYIEIYWHKSKSDL